MAKTLMFMMNAQCLEEFYIRCQTYNAETEADRISVLVDMALDGWPVSISETGRTREQIISDLQRNYGNVLSIEHEREKEV